MPGLELPPACHQQTSLLNSRDVFEMSVSCTVLRVEANTRLTLTAFNLLLFMKDVKGTKKVCSQVAKTHLANCAGLECARA